MNNLAAIFAGGRIVADDVRNIAPLSAYKGADEPLASGVGTLQNDDALFVPLDANTTYFFIMFFGYKGGTQGASDLKIGFTLPAGATMRWGRLGITTAGVNASLVWNTESSASTFGTNGTGNAASGIVIGTVTTSDTAGDLQFQWCQNSGAAVTTTVLTGSELMALAI